MMLILVQQDTPFPSQIRPITFDWMFSPVFLDVEK